MDPKGKDETFVNALRNHVDLLGRATLDVKLCFKCEIVVFFFFFLKISTAKKQI